MPALNFMPQFIEAVESGAKRQTIRRKWKDGTFPFQCGSRLIFYAYQRSRKCRKLWESVCIGVKPVQIERNGDLWVGGERLTADEKDDFAVADGFCNFLDLYEWFRRHHSLPFEGWVICW